MKKILISAMICAPAVMVASQEIQNEKTVSLLKDVFKANSYYQDYYDTKKITHDLVKSVVEKTNKLFPNLNMEKIKRQTIIWEIQEKNINLPKLYSRYSGGRSNQNKLTSIELCIFGTVKNLEKHLESLEK